MVKFNLSQRDDKSIPDLKSGDIVKVHRKIKEGEKERIQIFEGIIIAINGKQSSSPTITVRKVSNGVGVELVLPVFSPNIDKIEIVKRAQVRRSKLYYIRDKSAKSLRLKYKDIAEFAAVEDSSGAELEEKEESVSDESLEGAKEEKNENKEEKKNVEEKSSEDKPAEKKESKKEASDNKESKEGPSKDKSEEKSE